MADTSKTEIVETEDVLGGKPRVDGTRISTEQIHEMHTFRDLTPEEIADLYPTLTVAGAKAAITYEEQHRGEQESPGLEHAQPV